MNDIFISYARDDQKRLRPLKNALEAKGFLVLVIEQELQDYLNEAEHTTRDKIRVVVSNDSI